MTSFLPPQTVAEAIEELFRRMSEEDRKQLSLKNTATGIINPRAMLHTFTMMHVRNQWLLHDKSSPIVQDARKTYGVSHGDDVSGLIQAGFLAKIDGVEVEVDLHAQAQSYRDHWAKMGVDPHGE